MKKYLMGLFALVALLPAACTNSREDNPGFSRESTAGTNGKPDGQALFVQNCAVCHQKERDAVGPALKGVLERWNGDRSRLYAFIRDNEAAIAQGDPRAVEVKNKWKGAMPAFPQLTDAQIEAIVNHVE